MSTCNPVSHPFPLNALTIGWIGLAIFGPGTLTDQEQVMPNVMITIFPPALAALLIAGAIAAMVSTADSLLILAVIALIAAYFSPSDLIYTLVSYVWAGVGAPFSVVILLTLFWKRFHGRAAVITILTGLLITVLWVVIGFEKHAALVVKIPPHRGVGLVRVNPPTVIP